jgi:hypothetical protein
VTAKIVAILWGPCGPCPLWEGIPPVSEWCGELVHPDPRADLEPAIIVPGGEGKPPPAR